MAALTENIELLLRLRKDLTKTAVIVFCQIILTPFFCHRNMDFNNSGHQFEFVGLTYEPDGDESVEQFMDGVNNSFAMMNESKDNSFERRIECVESRINHFQKSLVDMSTMRAKGEWKNCNNLCIIFYLFFSHRICIHPPSF